jgi:hypothetical protein
MKSSGVLSHRSQSQKVNKFRPIFWRTQDVYQLQRQREQRSQRRSKHQVTMLNHFDKVGNKPSASYRNSCSDLPPCIPFSFSSGRSFDIAVAVESVAFEVFWSGSEVQRDDLTHTCQWGIIRRGGWNEMYSPWTFKFDVENNAQCH